jgi:sulfate permease, SulP family
VSEEGRSASAIAGPARVRGWRAAFPPAQWLPAYRPQWLGHDAISGVTLAAYGIYGYLAGGGQEIQTAFRVG